MSTPEEIQADIERQRTQLAETVDALGHKLDVKGRTSAKVDDVKAQTRAKVDDVLVKVHEVKDQAGVKVREVKGQATTDSGSPRPEVIGGLAATVVVVIGLFVWLRGRR